MQCLQHALFRLAIMLMASSWMCVDLRSMQHQHLVNPIDQIVSRIYGKIQKKRIIQPQPYSNVGWAKHVAVDSTGRKHLMGYEAVDLKYLPVAKKPHLASHRKPIVLKHPHFSFRPVHHRVPLAPTTLAPPPLRPPTHFRPSQKPFTSTPTSTPTPTTQTLPPITPPIFTIQSQPVTPSILLPVPHIVVPPHKVDITTHNGTNTTLLTIPATIPRPLTTFDHNFHTQVVIPNINVLPHENNNTPHIVYGLNSGSPIVTAPPPVMPYYHTNAHYIPHIHPASLPTPLSATQQHHHILVQHAPTLLPDSHPFNPHVFEPNLGVLPLGATFSSPVLTPSHNFHYLQNGVLHDVLAHPKHVAHGWSATAHGGDPHYEVGHVTGVPHTMVHQGSQFVPQTFTASPLLPQGLPSNDVRDWFRVPDDSQGPHQQLTPQQQEQLFHHIYHLQQSEPVADHVDVQTPLYLPEHPNYLPHRLGGPAEGAAQNV